jgi:hypothetical protein
LQNRQAIAEIAASSLGDDAAVDAARLVELKAKAAALSFRSHQDALDFVRHSVEDTNRRLAAQSLNAVDRYRKGEVTAYIGIRSRLNGSYGHLAFRCVPAHTELGREWEIETGYPVFVAVNISPENDLGLPKANGDECEMFLGISDLVECPEGTILSFISLEPFKNRTDFRWQILASSGQVALPVVFGWAKGKFDGFERGPVSGESGRVACLVEDGAEIVDGIEKDARQHLWNFLSEADSVKIRSGLRLFINEVGPWLSVCESVNDIAEITDVMLCANEGQSRAVETINHGKRPRSNERPKISAGGEALFDDATSAA